MKHLLAPAVLLLVLLGTGPTGEADEPELIRIPGSRTEIRAPRNAPELKAVTPAAGEWTATWAAGGEDAWFQVRTFPVRGNKDPARVLTSAVDTLLRGMGVSGFGMPTRSANRVWGQPAADGVFEFALDGVKRGGRVRLLLDPPQRWVMAVCFGRFENRLKDMKRMKAFVESLVPTTPKFYNVQFGELAKHGDIRLGVRRGAPVTLADLAATEAVLESGLGYRVPLGDRPAVRRALLVLPRQEGAAGIQAMRDMKRALDQALKQPAADRLAYLAPLGQKMLEGMRKRVDQSDRAALAVLQVVMRLDEAKAQHEDKRLPAALWRARLEMAAFLVSVLRNEVTRLDLETQGVLDAALGARFQKSADAFLRADRDWARLRRAWDQAEDSQRHALRRALATLLLPEALAKPMAAAETPRALFRAMADAYEKTTPRELLTRAAWTMDWAPLWKALGTSDAGFHFGW